MEINTFENGFFWNNYGSIEQDFLRFMEYTPYCPSNRKIYSPKLTGMLLQIGGYVDSAFKEMAAFFDMVPNQIENIVDAFAVFETIYKLSKNNGGELIAKLDFGDKKMDPFKYFSKKYYSAIKWWAAYNDVKHNYSLNYKKATIDNVLEGLAGAFLINVVHYPSQKHLWELGNLSTGMKAGEGFQEVNLSETNFESYWETAVSDFSFLNIGVRVETPLFLYARK